jgi:serine/threonine protein phosphatase PrpC
MAVGVRLRSAFASDMGLRRTNNEDRYFVDADRGIFAVIDGVGGHAAGEHAAETAVEVMRERLQRQTGTPEERLREAIALANNEIYRLSRSRLDWNGMACVLTVALVEDDVVTVGHVGDSRLYLLQPGRIQKMTHDHSPVGEREDRGELAEIDAMRHARRNEIFRDVGSGERVPEDPAFIEILKFPMPDDGALLLCSDGLTDLITSDEIRAGLERYAPDYEAAIAALIDAANAAGGKDNITVVVVAAPGYKPFEPDTEPTAAIVRKPRNLWWLLTLFIGAALGFAGGYFGRQFGAAGPVTLVVGQAGINAAMAKAHPGDTVLIPPGTYSEHVQLHEGVALRSQQPNTVTISSPDGGPVVTADGIESGSLEGVWLQGAGISLHDAGPTISNTRISGAQIGIGIAGRSEPSIVACQIENNLGAGIFVGPGAKPKIERNLIAANGDGKPGPAKPGVEVAETAKPVLKDNAIVNNGSEPVWIHGKAYQPADFDENFFGALTAKDAVRLVDLPAAEEEKPRPARQKPGAKK